MEAYQLFGTPEDIWAQVQGGISSSTESVAIDNSKINIYPNPTKGIIHIQLNGLVVDKMVLLDNLGADLTTKVQHILKDKEQMVLNLENLVVGTYYLVLNGDIIEKIQRR